MAIIGSSFYRPIDGGVTAGGTGPTGPAGPIGPTGPTGSGVLGTTGSTGAGVTSMHISGDNLVTIFQQADGITFEYVTTTDVIGPTGSSRILIDGKNVGVGATVFYNRMQPSEIKLRSFELAEPNNGYLSIIEDSSLRTININYDIGSSGHLNVHSGNTGEMVGFVHVTPDSGDPIQLHGFTGTTYDFAQKAINVRIKSFKEKSKFLTLSDDVSETPTTDFYRVVEGVDPWSEFCRYEGSIDPSQAKVFVLDMAQLSGIPDNGFAPLLVDIQNAKFGYTGNGPKEEDGVGKAFTLIVNGAANPYSYTYRFSNTIWPYNQQPCFSGGTDIFNFFWLPCTPEDTDNDGDIDYCPNGHAWYGSIAQGATYSCNSVLLGGPGDPRSNPVGASGSDRYLTGVMDYPGIELNSFGITGSTGACCLGDGDCVHTTENLCYGYFVGNGMTCGSTYGGITGSCFSKLGSCCVHYQDIDTVECFERLSADECITLRKLLNVSSVFGGSGASCLEIDCDLSSKREGACCDGAGGCQYLTQPDCVNTGWVFIGEGIPCTSNDGIDVCFGGTGACCTGITCSNDQAGMNCLDNSGFYAGHGTSCDQVKCNTEIRGRRYNVSSLNLEPGDMFAGGMVVGLYQPMNSWCYGSDSFGQNQMSHWGRLITGAEGSTLDGGQACKMYRSKYDHHGYGFTSDGPCPKHTTDNVDDAYYIIVSMSPIGITADRDVVNMIDEPNADSDFYWSNHGSSWGPIYNQNTNRYDDLNDAYKTKFKLQEGYWYNQYTGKESLDNLPINTFNSCHKARIYGGGGIQKAITAPNQTAHGFWKRNWGLYNTIRMVSADNALYLNYSDPDGGYNASQFGPVIRDEISSVRAVRLYDDGFSATGGLGSTGENVPEVSSWYLPSHDELAFVAANCVSRSPYDFNLNSDLLSHEKGVPFDGWYWTSTGAFDERKGYTADYGEGVISGMTGSPNPGSLAWAINFDINGERKQYLTGKKGRTTNRYQVRPIRIVRLDGEHSPTNKLWKVPKLDRDSDKGINQ